MLDQPPPESVLHWLYTNAPAAWISALVSLTLFFTSVRLRKRPKRLLVREVQRISFLYVAPAIRSEILTTFAGKPVSDLELVQFELSNEGSEPIQSPSVIFTLPQETRILRVLLVTDDDPSFDSRSDIRVEDGKITVTVPYVNSFREHRQLHKLAIIADGETIPIKVAGSGESWSVRHLPALSRNRIRRDIKTAATLFFVTGIMLVYVYILRSLGFGHTTPRLIRVLAFIPYIALMGFSLFYSWDSLKTLRLLWRFIGRS